MAVPIGDLDLPRYRMSLDDPTPAEYHDEVGMARGNGWIQRWLCGYVVFGHDDVTALLRERRLHQAAGKVPGLLAGIADPVSSLPADDILLAEGEKHLRLRRLVAEAFSPKSIDTLRPAIRSHVERLVHEGLPAGTGFVEFQSMIDELPVAVIGDMLGTGRGDFPLYSKWAESHFQVLKSSAVGDTERDARLARDAAEFDRYCVGLIEGRRNNLSADLLSKLIIAEEAGDRLSTGELVSLIRSFIAAGIDTTRNQLGSMMALILDTPGAWERLRGEPSLVAGAVEESLRLLNPIRMAMRLVHEPFEYREVHFPVGTLIGIGLSGASHDSTHFPVPDSFEPSRTNARDHMAFSFGVHHCLGAALARAELQETLSVLLQRWESVDLAAPIEWKHAKLPVWGPSRVPLRVTAV
ncbi:MAG: cytochrome P450 [Actinobacteria bacterium]|nr:cytochrome P450 [Actinomycetota bacterium]